MARRWVAVLFALLFLLASCASDGKTQVVATRKVTTTTAPPPPPETTTTAAPLAPAAPRIQKLRSLPGESAPRAPRAPREPRAAAAPRGPVSTGRIIIPRIGLDHATFEGVDLATIDYGPSHWPGTAEPGDHGNTVFPGHRVTHSHPFFNIDLLREGDHVIFVRASGRYTYEVTRYFTVTPDETWIADPTDDATFTIFACHPKHSAQQRYVVKGRLISSERNPAPPPPSNSSDNAGGGSTEPAPPPPSPTTTRPCSICVPPIGT